jgi:hypothetical protein
MLIRYANTYQAKFEHYYDKYCEPVFNGTYQPAGQSAVTSTTPANSSTQATVSKVSIQAKPGATFCRIVAYDPKYSPAVRRHVYLSKKQGNSYKVTIGGSAVTS